VNDYTATYSPEDNKLRLYATSRLDAETYARVKATGFKWAPKQELFVAPMWTPAREDLLIELAGDIEDEDTTLVERAEAKADRLETLSERRAVDADHARVAVAAIADNIPFGQPILVGHHSERHARKDAERIENGMRKAIKCWELSKYWKDRATNALCHAKYKELPAVRHRRIKGLESDLRKFTKERDQAASSLKAWDKDTLTDAQALCLANYEYTHYSFRFPLDKYPRELPASTYEGDMSLWSAMDGKIINGQQARALLVPCLRRTIAYCERWIAHLENRLSYEKAMLGEQGDIPAAGFDLQIGGQILASGLWLTILKINKANGAVSSVSTNNRQWPRVVAVERIKDYRPPTAEQTTAAKKAKSLPPICNYPGDGFVEITQAQWNDKHADYKGTRIIEATATADAHRVRSGFFSKEGGYRSVLVYITDAKEKRPPKQEGTTDPTPLLPPIERDLPSLEKQAARSAAFRTKVETEESGDFAKMKDALQAGVVVVSAPQLFPTPKELADKLVKLAAPAELDRILEPSAGTGNIVSALLRNYHLAEVMIVELAPALAEQLCSNYGRGHCNCRVKQGDFLLCNGDLGVFDKIIMNPPFANGQDITHIEHARKFLKPGGRLVAICANGPRQREKLMAEATYWEDLPAGSFKESGTNVNAAIVVIDA